MMDPNLQLLKKIHAGANESYRDDDEIVSHIGILRSWIDSEEPDKLAYVFDPDDNRFYDRLFTIHKFLSSCEQLIKNEEEECFFTINSFWRKKKQSEDIRHLNAFVLDFDYYKLKKYQSLSPPEMYEQYIKHTLTKKPTAVIDSGRGLYVIYAFQHCSIKRIKLYQSIYKQLLEKFKDYGMDAMATNITQVIRIPGTYNVRANKAVRILEFTDTDYQLTDFCDLLPYTYDQVSNYKNQKRKNLKEIKKTQKANEEVLKERKKQARSLLQDLEKLIAIRNHNKVYEGYREQLIYMALEKLLWAGYDKNKAIEKASVLNNAFHVPLHQNDIEKQCMPAKVYYCSHSKETIIRKLEITDQEQMKLKTLKTRKNQDLYRKKLKNKHPLLNRTKKEVELLKRRTEIIRKKQLGYRNIDIANSLDIDKSTVTNDIHYIERHKQEFRRILGETIEALISALDDDDLLRTVVYDETKRLRKWVEISAYVLSDP